MRNARCYFAAVVLKKELYAMGGECGGRVRVVLETVEALGLHSQKWTKKPSLPQPRVFHGAAAFQVSPSLGDDFTPIPSSIREFVDWVLVIE